MKPLKTNRIFILSGLCALAACWPHATPSRANTPVTVTVQSGARQTFRGLGTSQGRGRGYAGEFKLSPPQRLPFQKLIWNDARFRILKMWVDLPTYSPAPGQESIDTVANDYGQMITDAKAQGCSTVMMTIDRFPLWMSNSSNNGIQDQYVDDFAAMVARVVSQFKERTGHQINGIDIINEPEQWKYISPVQLVTVVNTLRAELNARGLGAVKLIAPSTPNTSDFNCDTKTCSKDYIDALKADGKAWKNLDGVASHSYNMAGTTGFEKLIAGKDYWQTESGQTDHLESKPGVNAWVSASIASRFLHDVNHGCTHWLYFMGFNETTRENGLSLMTFSPSPFRFEVKPQYFYLKRLAHTFDVGARFRDSQSSLHNNNDGGDMTWTYGPKPSLFASAALNPDGTWGIAMVNYTAASFPQDPNFATGGTPATTFDVTLRLAQARGKATGETKTFHVFKCDAGAPTLGAITSYAGTATMENGSLTIRNLGSCEMVTLRQARPKAQLKTKPKPRPTRSGKSAGKKPQ